MLKQNLIKSSSFPKKLGRKKIKKTVSNLERELNRMKAIELKGRIKDLKLLQKCELKLLKASHKIERDELLNELKLLS